MLTCVLPYAEMCGFLWCYTALPLHFVDSNWPLWQLAALLTFCYLPRLIILIMTQKFARVGDDWLCVPVSAIAFASNVLMWSYPHNLAAVSVAICTTCTSLCPTVLRSLVYRRFAESGEWQRQRALRIFTLSDTFGYATAPFIGGVLYDHGGLRACAGFALTTSALGMLLPLGLSVYRRSLPSACRLCVHGEHGEAARASRGASDAMDGQQGDASGVARSGDVEAPPEQAPGALAALLLAPTVMIMAGVFANICTYAVEWCLYAIYFRLEYDWTGSWTGFAQMIGDLLGGTVLGLSTMACVTRRAGRVTLPRTARVLLQPPLGVATLLCCHAALMVMLAQPHFAVALTGQIIMGTVYVFCEQQLQEMLLVYSFGNHRLYRRLVSLHYLSYTAGCALCAPIAYGLYEVSGFAGAFYATAGCAVSAGITFATYFTCRLAPTSNGMLASLREAERELLDSKARSDGAPPTATLHTSAQSGQRTTQIATSPI